MAILDSIKDPNTGKIKTPILISLVGAGGLMAYLVLKGGSSGTTTSAGQSSPLTPDLTGLQTALQSLGGGGSTGGAGGGSGNVLPPGSYLGPPATAPGDTNTNSISPSANYTPGSVPTLPTTPIAQPSVAQAPGSSGSAGGGGGGTGQVIQPIAKAPTVYGGVTVSSPAVIAAKPTTATPGYTPVVNSYTGFVTGVTPVAKTLAQDIAVYQAIPAAQRTAKQSAALATDIATNAKQTGSSAPIPVKLGPPAPTPVYHAPTTPVAPKSNAKPTKL